MPEFKPGRTLVDYLGSFELGMNAGSLPLLLPKNQASFLLNATVRGGFAMNRPPFTKFLTFSWDSDATQTTVETGLFQGACYYKPDTGYQCLIAQIAGRLFRFSITGNNVSVSDITVPGDPNPPDRTQAWLWQADKWVIVNDGISLPIFYDGSTSRRSYGPSIEAAVVTAGPGTVPEIGSVGIYTITPPYIGRYDEPVLFNGGYYQPILNNGFYNSTLQNVSDLSGATYPDLTPVIARPSVIAVVQTLAEQYMVAVGEVSFPAGTYALSLEITTDATAIPVNAVLTIISADQDSVGRPISSKFAYWRVTARSGNVLSLVNAFAGSVRNAYSFGYSYAHGSVVQIYGSTAPDVVIGNLDDPITVPVGSAATVKLDRTYTGADGQRVFIDGKEYAITGIPSDVDPLDPTLIMVNLSDAAGATYTYGTGLPILTVPELPAGRMGAYCMGQNWVSSVDGLTFIISDLSRGASGTQANDYRDSVLKVVDLTFGGGSFAIPISGAYITSITPVPKLDESLGQGPVQIGTQLGVFTGIAPFDFYNPPDNGTAILPEVLKGYGPLSQNATVLVNSDTFFRSINGYASLIQARRDFDTWGNTTISEEVNDRILINDDEQLLPYGSGCTFDNRWIGTVSPQTSNSGVIHAGVAVINLDPVSSLRGKEQPVYDGIWTGVNALQYVTGSFDNLNRAFAFGYNVESAKVELYEILPTFIDNRFDNGYIPITWGFESAAIFNKDIKDPHELIKLMDGEIALDNVLGRVRIQAWYKMDQGCWIPWTDFSICADTEGSPQGLPRIGLGAPPSGDCNAATRTNGKDGYSVQVKLQFTGSCRFLRGRFKAVTLPTQEFATPICNAGCSPDQSSEDPCEPCVSVTCPEMTPDLQIYGLQSNIVFNSEPITIRVPCPDGWTCNLVVIVTYPPGTFVLPDPDDRGLYVGMVCNQVVSAPTQAEFFRLLAEGMAQCHAISDPPDGWQPPLQPPVSVPTISLGAISQTSSCLGGVLSATINATSNDSRPVLFVLESGSLPTGATLSYSGKTATISGTPSVTGTFTFIIRATDLRGATTIRSYTIYVAEIAEDSLPDGETGTAYSQTLTVDGPTTGSEVWQVTSGALPDGLSLNASTGEITGTPTVEGDFTFIVCFSNSL